MTIFKLTSILIPLLFSGTAYSLSNIDYNKLSGLVFTDSNSNIEKFRDVLEYIETKEKAYDKTNLKKKELNQDNRFLGTYRKESEIIIVHKYNEDEMEATIADRRRVLKKSGSNEFKNEKIILDFSKEGKVKFTLVGSFFAFYFDKQEPISENSENENLTVTRTHYNNGQLKEEITKSGEVWNGPYKKWDEQGNLIEKTLYKKGANAKVEYFYANGKLKSRGETYWNNSKKENTITGLWQSYYPNGQLKEENECKHGRLIKQVNLFLENGKQIIKNGTGYHIDFYENGQEKYNITIINGVRNGLATWYFENGNIKKQALYASGGNNYEGLRMEIIQVNDVNGEPLDKGTLKNGNGTWKSYDANGKLTGVNTYKDGILIE